VVTFLHALHKMKNFLNRGFWVALFILFFAGGLGLYLKEFRILVVIIQAVLLIVVILSRHKVFLPKGFLLFILFLLLIWLNMAWSKGRLATLEYLILLSGGGAFWLLFFNLGEKFKDTFGRLVIVLGIVYGGSFLVNLLLFPQVPIRSWTLYLPGAISRNHNHLGDLWAVVMLLVVHKLLTRPKWWHWVVSAVGVFFLAVSLSRSAYLSLGIGAFYLFNKLGLAKRYRSFYILFLVLAASLFLYAAFFKSTLLARPYVGQVLWGFSKWPWGVGVGNFGIISADSQSPWWNVPTRAGIVTTSAHNLALEMISGMGVLGFVFAFWLVYVLVDILKNSKEALFSAIFLAIGVNFMFDTTYYIPTMLWLWFASLGLSLKR